MSPPHEPEPSVPVLRPVILVGPRRTQERAGGLASATAASTTALARPRVAVPRERVDRVDLRVVALDMELARSTPPAPRAPGSEHPRAVVRSTFAR